MLTQFRHIQKGTLIVVTAIVVVAFSFLYSDFDFVRGSVGSQKCVFKVYNKCYKYKQALKLFRTAELADSLGMNEYTNDMFGRERTLDNDRTEMVMRMMVFREEAKKLGVYPSYEEVQNESAELRTVKEIPLYDKGGLKDLLARRGFTYGDYTDLVRDFIAWKRVRALLTAGIEPVSSEIDAMFTQRYQRYDVTVIDFDRKDYLDKVEVAEDAIKNYHEKNQTELMTEPQRAFIAAHFVPVELPDDATFEQKAVAEKAFKEETSKVIKEITDNPDDFEKIVKQKQNSPSANTVELHTFDTFNITDAPEFFDGKEDVIRKIFDERWTKGNVTATFSQDDGSYLRFKVTEVVPAEPLTLDAARDQIVTVLKNRDSDQLASDAASAAKATLLDAVKSGKSIDDAAKEAGLKTRKIPNFSLAEPPGGIDDAGPIMLTAMTVGQGEIGGPRPKPNTAGHMLVHIDKIVIYENDPSEEFQRKMLSDGYQKQLRTAAFDAWFSPIAAANSERASRVDPDGKGEPEPQQEPAS